MGWFDRARSFVSGAALKTGGVLRRIGDVAAPVIRKVGDIAGSRLVKAGVTALGVGLAPMTGGASLGIAGAVNKGLDLTSKYAGHANDIAGKISSFGSKLQTVGQTIGGIPQGSSAPSAMQGRRIMAS
jgi:hypothetical protein